MREATSIPLGAMLYALVTGRPPFNAESTAATIMQLIEKEPVPPTLLNASVDRDSGDNRSQVPTKRQSESLPLREGLGQ